MEPTTATTIPEENAVNTTNVCTEPAPTEQVTEETGAVEYQEAPSASAVPVPTFTPQQPLAAPSSGIAAPPQNLKTLPHGAYIQFNHLHTNVDRYRIFDYYIHHILAIFVMFFEQFFLAERLCVTGKR